MCWILGINSGKISNCGEIVDGIGKFVVNKVGMVKFDNKGEIGKEFKFPPPIKGPVFMLHFSVDLFQKSK